MSDFEYVDISTGLLSVKTEKKKFLSIDDIKKWLYHNGANAEEFVRFGVDDNRLVRWGIIERGLITDGRHVIKIGFSYLDFFSLEIRGDTPEEMLEDFFYITSDENEIKMRVCLDITNPNNRHDIWTNKNYAGVYVDYILGVIRKLREGLSEYF